MKADTAPISFLATLDEHSISIRDGEARLQLLVPQSHAHLPAAAALSLIGRVFTVTITPSSPEDSLLVYEGDKPKRTRHRNTRKTTPAAK
jgi:hypothetical protein